MVGLNMAHNAKGQLLFELASEVLRGSSDLNRQAITFWSSVDQNSPNHHTHTQR